MKNKDNDLEKKLLVQELNQINNIQVNPDFEEQVYSILDKYIVFRKDRLSKRE